MGESASRSRPISMPVGWPGPKYVVIGPRAGQLNWFRRTTSMVGPSLSPSTAVSTSGVATSSAGCEPAELSATVAGSAGGLTAAEEDEKEHAAPRVNSRANPANG